MISFLRRRLAGETGVSLVEMMVAILILGIVLTALATTLITSLQAIARNERLIRATQLANENLENWQALPWDRTGFYQSDVAALPSNQFEGEDYVTIPDESPPDPRVPVPNPPPVERDVITYTVENHITWVDEAITGDPEDYKRLVTIITWTDGTDTRTLRQEALRAPTPNEKNPSSFAIRFYDVTPDFVYITDTGANTVALELYVETIAPAAQVQVTYPLRDGTPRTRLLTPTDANSTRWTTTIPQGNENFANGDAGFEFVATSPAPESLVASAIKQVRFLHDVAVVVLTADPNPVRVTEDGTVCDPAVVLQTEVQGLIGEDTVTVTGMGLVDEIVPFVGTTVRGATYEITIDTAGLPQGGDSLTVTGVRGFDLESDTASVQVATTVVETC